MNIPGLTVRLPLAVKILADNKRRHHVNGEVQTRAYANTALLIASVIVHYADERGMKIKNKPEICTSYASREPPHRSHSWMGYNGILCQRATATHLSFFFLFFFFQASYKSSITNTQDQWVTSAILRGPSSLKALPFSNYQTLNLNSFNLNLPHVITMHGYINHSCFVTFHLQVMTERNWQYKVSLNTSQLSTLKMLATFKKGIRFQIKIFMTKTL